MTAHSYNLIRERLLGVLSEMQIQTHLALYYGGKSLTFDEEMEQIHEFIEIAGEYGVAYEVIVSSLEDVPFVLSGKAAVRLLEIGLLFGYKTDKQADQLYDRRIA